METLPLSLPSTSSSHPIFNGADLLVLFPIATYCNYYISFSLGFSHLEIHCLSPLFFNLLLGKQGWRSGESTRLPPLWPGFDSRTRRHMWVEFVVGSCPCSEGFSPGSPVFLPPQKSTLLNSNSIWTQWMKSHLVKMPLKIPLSLLLLLLLLLLLISFWVQPQPPPPSPQEYLTCPFHCKGCLLGLHNAISSSTLEVSVLNTVKTKTMIVPLCGYNV